MKKLFLSASLLLAVLFSVKAQKGNNQIGIAAEVGFPTGSFKDGINTGFGGTIRGLIGVGNTGQVTVTTGYVNFQAEGNTTEGSASAAIVPILAGYRLSMGGLYIEPQLGYGVYIAKVKFDGATISSSSGAFTYSAGVGFAKNKIDIGVRYQSGSVDGDNVGYVGVHLGYNFSLGVKK